MGWGVSGVGWFRCDWEGDDGGGEVFLCSHPDVIGFV